MFRTKFTVPPGEKRRWRHLSKKEFSVYLLISVEDRCLDLSQGKFRGW